MSQVAFLQDMQPHERKHYLETNASKIDTGKYSKSLTEDEIIARKDVLAESSIKLNDLETEFKEIKDDYKTKMAPFKAQIGLLLSDIRTKQTIVDGALYHMADHINGYMETYNEAGEMINSRKLRPDEKQGSVFQMGMAK